MSTALFIALGNEVRKGLRFAWAERLQILIELPMFAVLVIVLGPVVGEGHQIVAGHLHWSLDSRRTSVLVMWFVPFIFLYMQVVKLFWRLLGEMQAGTLEQVYLSPLPSWVVAAGGRVAAALVETIFVAAATYGIVNLFVPLHVGWSAAALLPALIIVVTGVGISLIIGGATLVWKRIQLAIDGALMLVMLTSAAALPLIAVPDWWANASRFFPLTAGVAGLYRALFLPQDVTSPWGMGGMVSMLVTAAAYLAAGILAFRLGERTAWRRGTLSRY
ncbi:MAG: ABC transporter permease [Candidatus Dormibacteria bacterium]